MQPLVLFFSLFPIVAATAEVDVDATTQFASDIKTYFEKALGEDAIKQTQYVDKVPKNLGETWTEPTVSAGTMLKPIGFVLLKNNLICRTGLGFIWVEGSPEMKPRTTVLAECLPLSAELAKIEIPLSEKYYSLVTQVLTANAAFDDIVERAKLHLAETFTDSHVPLARFSYAVADRFVKAEKLWSYLDHREMNREFESLKFGAYAQILFEFGPKGETRQNVKIWETELKSCNGDLIVSQPLKAEPKYIRYLQ
jgi:hypothetical protein